MQMSEIFASVKKLAEDDQSIADATITDWVDMGINRINQSLQANIPITKGKPTTYVPEFDVRFHESLVLFAVAKYYEGDSAFNNAQYFMGEFQGLVSQMQRDMVLKPSTMMDYNTIQFIVPSAATLTYMLNLPYGSYFDDIRVYHNDGLVDPMYYVIDGNTGKLTFRGYVLATNDKITVKYENNSDLNSPPYQWWGAW